MSRKEYSPRRHSPLHKEFTPGEDKTSELLQRLETQVGEITDSASFQRYLKMQSKFPSYSMGNVMLILSQKPDATKVAGYNAWQSLGRQVQKGEKGIKIIAPRVNRDKETDERKVTGFGVATVFDISSTQGQELPRGPEVPILEDETGGVLYDDLARLAGEENIRVDLAPPVKGFEDRMGYFNPESKRIVVREDVPQLQRTKTLAHELGHYFTGLHETYGELRDEHEAIAEGSAYVILARYNLDSAIRSVPYVATWIQDRDRFRQVLGTIQATANTVISRIEKPPKQP